MAEKYTHYRGQRNGTRPAYESWGNGKPHHNHTHSLHAAHVETSQAPFQRAAEPVPSGVMGAMLVFMMAMQQVRSGDLSAVRTTVPALLQLG